MACFLAAGAMKLTWEVIPDGATSIVQVRLEEIVAQPEARTFARELVVRIAEALGDFKVRDALLAEQLGLDEKEEGK